jgi:hypothetical protein
MAYFYQNAFIFMMISLLIGGSSKYIEFDPLHFFYVFFSLLQKFELSILLLMYNLILCYLSIKDVKQAFISND